MSNSVQPYGQQPTRLLWPWDSLGKNTAVGCHFLLPCMHAKSLQSSPTLCDPMDSSPPGSSVHGILQARTLEWVAISFSRESLSIVFLPSQVNSILTVACRGFNTLCFVLVSFHILFLLIILVGSYSEGFPKM